MTKPLAPAELKRVLSHCAEVDSLRALAMIGVVAMHAKIFPVGWAGVWLFFVISGYVVTLSIARNHDPRRPLQGATRFLKQRAARILPPYYAYLLLGLLLSTLFTLQQPLAAIASLFGFYHNVAMAEGIGELYFWPVGHLWTISVEMQFYLLFGLVAYFCPLWVTKRVLWACVILSPLARLLTGAVLAGGDPEATAYLIYSAPGMHFDSFAIGCLFAIARLTIPLERLLWPVVRVGAIAMGLYLISFFALNLLVRDREGIEIVRDVVSGILYGEGREVFLYTALGLSSLALLALTLARHPLVRPITSLAVLQWIGRISYGCYIYHALGLRVAALLVGGRWGGIDMLSLPRRVAVFAIGLGLTVALAQLSWKLVEQPAMALVRRRKKPTEARSDAHALRAANDRLTAETRAASGFAQQLPVPARAQRT